ncbi:MAG: hypothetical protein NTY19_05530 [Planctomycetota bacterium]|nr:hypothetical protein [Planctomycetota bacterium]
MSTKSSVGSSGAHGRSQRRRGFSWRKLARLSASDRTKSRSRPIFFESLESRVLLSGTTDFALGTVWVRIPDYNSVAPGSHLTVEVNIGEAVGVRAADILIRYDSSLLTTTNDSVHPGSLWPTVNAQAYANDRAISNDPNVREIDIWVFGADPLGSGTGSLATIDFVTKTSVTARTGMVLDLRAVKLNEGQIDLADPRPQPGDTGPDLEPSPVQPTDHPPLPPPSPDPTDGTVWIDPVQPPVITVPTTLIANEDQDAKVLGIGVTDPYVGTSQIKLTLAVEPRAVEHGKLSVKPDVPGGVPSSGIVGNGTDHVELQGTVAEINTTLADDGDLTYRGYPDYYGQDTLTVTADDLGNNVSGTRLTATKIVGFPVNPVNDVPSFTASNPLAVDEDAGSQSIANWAAFNPGPTNESSQVVLWYLVPITDISNRSLFSVLPVVANDGTLTYTSAPDANGTSTFKVAVQDNGGIDRGGIDTSPTQLFTITVNPVNDPPVNHLPVSANTDINVPLIFSSANGNAISISDVDAGSSPVTVTLDCTHGSIKLRDGRQGPPLNLTGSLAEINAALDGLTFTPEKDFEGQATITTTTNDLGNSGQGGPKVTTDTLTIDVGRNARLSGFVYADTNKSNRPDVHEGVPGVRITLAGEGVTQETWTDENGRYEFRDLLGGTYQITQRHPAAFLEGGGTTLMNIQLGAGEVKTTNQFRELHLRPECIPNRFLATTTQPTGSDPWTELVRKVVGDMEVRSGNTTDPLPPAKSPEIVPVGREVTVYGTNGNDNFEFVAGADKHTVKVNGEIHEFDPSKVDKIIFDGRLGKDTARVVGTAGKDVATLSPTFGTVKGSNYDLRLAAFEQIQVDGVSGSDDQATLLDSFSDDTLTAGQKTTTLSGYYFSNRVTNFATVVAKSQSGGHDVVNEQPHDFVLTTQGNFVPQTISPSTTSQFLEATSAPGIVGQSASSLTTTVLQSPVKASGAPSTISVPQLAETDLKPIVAEAIARWDNAGLAPGVVNSLHNVEFTVADLSGSKLGIATGAKVQLDQDAAGYGWFVDPTPSRDEEFAPANGSQELQAVTPTAKGRMDLLTVVEHELGHVAGLKDLPTDSVDTGTDAVRPDPSPSQLLDQATAGDVMTGKLAVGIRRVAAAPAEAEPHSATPARQAALPLQAEAFQSDVAPAALEGATTKWSIVGTSTFAVQVHAGDQNVIRVLQTDAPLPANTEFRVTFNPRSTEQWSGANALMVFDYKSPTDFKYAGAFVSINRWAIGRMTERGYTIDKTVPGEFQSGSDYHLALRIEGETVSLTADGIAKLSHTFPEPLPKGRLGLLSWNNTSRFNDLAVVEI